MDYSGKIISPKWLFPYLTVFSFGILYFLTKIIESKTNLPQNLFWILLFLVINIATVLSRSQFRLSFEPELIKYIGLGDKLDIPYSKITGVYIQQSLIDKLLGLKRLIVKFDIPSEIAKVSIPLTHKTSLPRYPLEFPGTFGEFLTIPGLESEILDELSVKISTAANIKITDLGIGSPTQNLGSKINYYLTMALIIILVTLLIVSGLFYLYLQHKLNP